MAHPINFRTFDLNLLRVFDEVMTERSLTKAAHNLALTQPAVSNAMRRLRTSLGDELLKRSGQGLEATPHALEIWPTVREALHTLKTTLNPSEFAAHQASHVFVLTMADATAAELVPPLVNALDSEAPGVSLRVLPLTNRDPRKLLEDGSVDVAVGYFPAVLADLTARAQVGKAVAFTHQRLYAGDYVCVMRRDHALAHTPLTLDAFCQARHVLVSFSARPFGFIDQALASLGRQRRVVLTVNQFFTAARVTARSDLLTVFPKHFIKMTGIADQLTVRELPFAAPVVQVDALWHHGKDGDPAQQWLRGLVNKVAKDLFGPPGGRSAPSEIK